VRTLLADAKGRVWAGTSGSGLVLRADSSGSVTTVYDSSKMEVTTMTADSRGRVWAAAVSTETPAGSRELISAPGPTPAVRPSRGSNQRDEEPGAGRDRPEVTVTVSSPRLAPPHPGSRQGFQSEVILFEDGEPPRPVWNSSEEIVFGLAPAGTEAAVLAATGPKGKLYGLDPDGWSLIQTFDEKQVTFVAGKAIGTNSSSALYRPTAGERAGRYVSAVKDTGRTSRFGAFRWDGVVPPGASADFAFRSGESAAPDSTWSFWSAWIPATEARTVAAPPGRFLQWKVQMTGRGEKPVYLRTVEAAYRNQNAAPVLEAFLSMGPSEVLARTSSGGSNVFETTAPDEKGIFTGLEESKSEAAPRKLLRKGYRTLTWKVTDPDGDDLSYGLELKPMGSERWIPLREEMRESFYSFDTTSLPDGDYLFRLQASDARANPEDPKTSARESGPVRVDNTPPAIRRVSSSPGLLELEAQDGGSPITEAEYSVDAREWVRVEPKDGLSDSPVEAYAIRIDPGARGRFLLFRVTDASRNVAAASFAAP
jgi:hypothetical protein